MPLPHGLKELVDEPWTAWGPLVERKSISDAHSTRRNGEYVNSTAKKSSLSNSIKDKRTKESKNTHSRRLNNSEMIIFGLCPASEPLILISCSYCGHKFKSRFLPEHVKNRHFGAKKLSALKTVSPDKKKSPTHPKAKGKHSRLNRERERLNEAQNSADKTDNWPKSNTNNVEEIRRNEREISVTSVLPQCMIKIAAGEAVKEVTKPVKEPSKVKLRKTKSQLSEPMGSTINECPVTVEKPHSQKRESRLSNSEYSPGLDKSKTEVSYKKAKLDDSVRELKADDVKIEKGNCSEAPGDSRIVHIAETKPKKGHEGSNTRGGRPYFPDSHCGVISKDGRPCTRSLECKLHKISSRKAVKGRSKPFEILLVAFQKEKEMERNKVLEVEVVDAVPIAPANVKVEEDIKPKLSVESKTNFSELGKLSLPVSIINPNIRTKLIPSESVQQLSNHSQDSKTSASSHKILKSDKPLEFDKLSSITPPPAAINGFNKDIDLPFDCSIYPGYRKSAGLLTTSISVPRVQFKDKKRNRLSHPHVVQDKIVKRNSRYFLYLNGGMKREESLPEKSRLLQRPSRNVLATMPSIVDQMNPLKSLSCGAGIESDFVKKSLNLFGPINGTKVLPLTLAAAEKNSSQDSSSGFIKINDKKVECKGVGLLSGDVVCLESPRAHFFTPSGPLSIGMDSVATPKPDCKPLRPKLQYLPNSSITAPTLVYLQRTLKTAH